MKYYKITLNSVPKFLFCCAVTVNNYKNSFHKKPNFLEIAVNLDGCVVIKNKDYSCMIKKPPALAVHTSLSDYDLYAYENQPQSHITVGVEAEYSICEVDEQMAKSRRSDAENVIFSARYASPRTARTRRARAENTKDRRLSQFSRARKQK